MSNATGWLVTLAVVLLAFACGGSDAPDADTSATVAGNDYLVGRPQNRSGIGDVEAVVDRYAESRADFIELFAKQPWYKDGLTRDESLFVERSITFVARYSGPRTACVSTASIERKLYRYEKVAMSKGEVELLLIYEPGQDAEKEMRLLKQMTPAIEALVGVEFPERVMTVINGAFEINDFNDGQFIRMARCCFMTPFVLAHELAHTYWSMAPSWFNEGMADIYAILTIERLNKESPAGWVQVPGDLNSYYASRQRLVDSGRFPDDLILPRRFASDGLYEVADVFLLDIRDAIGDEAFRAAVREIYLTSDFGRFNLREKRIEDVFLAHAKPSARDDVMSLFNASIWGDNGERYQQMKEQEGS